MMAYATSFVAVCCISCCFCCCERHICPVVFASFVAIITAGIVTTIPARIVDFTVVNVVCCCRKSSWRYINPLLITSLYLQLCFKMMKPALVKCDK